MMRNVVLAAKLVLLRAKSSMTFLKDLADFKSKFKALMTTSVYQYQLDNVGKPSLFRRKEIHQGDKA